MSSDLLSTKFNYGSYYDGVQYALYELITDRFIFCSSDFLILSDMLSLFSSRYMLTMVRLDTASNFEHNLIDNECVYNWTGNNLRLLQTSDMQYSTLLMEADTLLPADGISNTELVVQDADYLQYTCNVIRMLNLLQSYHKSAIPNVGFYADQISSPVDTGYQLSHNGHPLNAYLLQKKVYDIIFTELDFTTAKYEVDALINDYNLHCRIEQ